MADLYSVIAGIEPDQQDIIEAELLARQILEAEFPNLDLREGTGVRDLVLRPAAFILAMAKKASDFYFTQNTFVGVTDETPTEMVDGILGNLFLTRNTGTYAVINARLYFARQKSVTIPSATSFSTDGALLFYPGSVISLPDTSMLYDSYQNEWYVDINLVAAQTGDSYNLSSGSLLYFSNFDPFFLHAEINYLAQSSTTAESNSQFIARAGSSISTRNLINAPSIDSNLRQNFNYIDKLLTIGSGAGPEDALPYMHRDQIFINGPRGVAKPSTSAAYSSSNTRLRLGLGAHGLIIGQLLDIIEIGGASWIFRSIAVIAVIDVDTFEVVIPFTFVVHTLGSFTITKVEPDLWLHVGGMVDVYAGDTTLVKQQQYTLTTLGKVVLYGPIYKTIRIAGGTDTVPYPTSYVTTYPGHTSRSDISLSQDGLGVLTLTAKAHSFTGGRMMAVYQWPTAASVSYLPVTQLVDADNVILGSNLALVTVDPFAVPSVTYVQPGRDTGFTTSQEIILDFGITHALQTVTLDTYSFDKITSIQSYLASSENRVICANFLARGFDIYILDFTLVFYDSPLPTTGTLSGILSPLLAAIQPGQDFLTSEITSAIVSSGLTSLQSPVSCVSTLYTKDLLPGVISTVTDHIKPISATCVYLLGDITVTLGVL